MLAVSIVLFIILLVALWYWLCTLLVMKRVHFLWMLAGLVLPLISQIVFFLKEKQDMKIIDAIAFFRYFIALVVFFVIYSIALVVR